MKSIHPRFLLSSVALTVCAITVPTMTYAQATDVRSGGLMKGDRADSEVSRQVNKTKSNVKNNRSDGGEASTGEARAINESGVSVKSDPKKNK